MLKYISTFLLIIVLNIHCSKDAATTNNPGGSAGTGGSLARFTVVGNYLYIAAGFSLSAFDISQAEPVLQSDIILPGNAETVFPYEDKLFIGSTTGMFVYSLVKPASPELLGQASHMRSCDPVVANDSIAFITLRGGTACGPATDGLYIHSLETITNPVLIKTVEIPTPYGLGLKNNYLYVCQQQNGLSIYNVQHPEAPVLLNKIIDDHFNDVIVYNNLLICYIQSGLKLFDISEPAAPKELSTVMN